MKNFLSKSILFSLPIIISGLLLFLLLNVTKENYFQADQLIKSKQKYIIGYAYNEDNYRYIKWKTLLETDRKEIWALGSSRVLQFRDKMFDQPFYNAGSMISSVKDFIPFLKSIPENKYPQMLIIGLDQWMFNANWDTLKTPRPPEYWSNSFHALAGYEVYKTAIGDIINNKFDYKKIYSAVSTNKQVELIGLNSVMNGRGFRNDGSMKYGNQISYLLSNDSRANDFAFADTYDRIEKGTKRFEYGDSISAEAVQSLVQVLQFCNNKHIQVVGILPPFANKVLQKMEQSGKYKFMSKLPKTLALVFDRHQFELWDFTSMSKTASSDLEAIDGFHGGELTYHKMLTCMVRNGSMLRNYTTLSRLNTDANQAVNRYTVYKD